MTNAKAIAITAVWIGIGMCGIGAGLTGDSAAFFLIAVVAFFGSVATKHIMDGEQ